MSDNRFLDDFIENLGESDMMMDDVTKQKILKKTYKKINRKSFYIKFAIAACLILAVLSSFIPNTPVYALRQSIFSFIPGIGVVQNDSDEDAITNVLNKPVRITDGEEFVEIRTAYTKNNVLTISGATNVGAVDFKDFKDISGFKEFFSGQTAPGIFLVDGGKKIKSGSQIWSGPSYESKVYNVKASFQLKDSMADNEFSFAVDGFQKQIDITLSPVRSGTNPAEMGSADIIDDVMIFADTRRSNDIVEVLVSAVAPDEYRNPRFYLYDFEKGRFKDGVYLIDQDGTRYEPDEEIRKQNDGGINTFFFHVPKEKEGLRLIVPQMLFEIQDNEQNMTISMPKVGNEVPINKNIELGGNTIAIEKASIITAGNDILPDEFKSSDCLKIDASSVEGGNSRISVLRVIPDVNVRRSIFGYNTVSQSVNAELWEQDSQNGYSLIVFDAMQETDKIMLTFQAEFSMAGPWELNLDINRE